MAVATVNLIVQLEALIGRRREKCRIGNRKSMHGSDALHERDCSLENKAIELAMPTQTRW